MHEKKPFIYKDLRIPSYSHLYIKKSLKMATQSAINWPEKYTPGSTDNYVSNEIIVKDLSVNDV
jgi:hypothetical protein